MKKPSDDTVWFDKGATMSDKSAREEFGLTEEEIVKAVRGGKLSYRVNSMFGNPYFRIVRSEVEALVTKKRGAGYVQSQMLKKELTKTDKELRVLKRKMRALEKRRAELLAGSDTRNREVISHETKTSDSRARGVCGH